MHTDLECMACFVHQALTAVRLSSNDPEVQRRVINATGKLLAELDLNSSPPENAVAVYQKIEEISGVANPFYRLKKESNDFALSLQQDIRDRVRNAEDSLYAAVRYAIAGNIIDYGVQQEFDALQTLSRCLEEELCIDDYGTLQKKVREGKRKKILYLADNCGEIVFDAVLIEQLQEYKHSVTMVVREKEILNDATMQDALAVGIDKICPIITNGSPCPGTPLASANNEMKDAFAGADLIISKGQGNFETLSDVSGPIYFLLTVKCPVVARHISSMRSVTADNLKGRGEMVLMQREV